jgi:hypothetical protein
MSHSKDELRCALGCVVYDMVMLALALGQFRGHKSVPMFKGLTWGEPQISIEVILTKCRTLMDFLSPPQHHPNDIVIGDFDLPSAPLPGALQIFRKSINQWSAHLSWQRALRKGNAAPQPLQSDMDVNAVWVLKLCHEAVEKSLLSGLAFGDSYHETCYKLFKERYTELVRSAEAKVTTA